jgi:histidinol-phosphate phosphatase family protein
VERIIFLDRDGTIINDCNYLSSPKQVSLLNGAGEALARLSNAGFRLLVVSNQSGVARGYFNIDSVNAANRKLNSLLEPYGVQIEKFYFCPHDPTDPIACECRKPLLGLYNEAKKDFLFSSDCSWMIGDKVSDIEFGINAGLHTIKIDSGNYKNNIFNSSVCQSLSEAADIILNTSLSK